MSKIQPRLALILITMAFIAAGCNPAPTSNNPPTQELKKGTVHIGNKSFPVEIADNDDTREQGLSDREILAADAGMIFIFPQPGPHGFWMKNTNFPLDFIWVRDGKVTEISSDVPTQLGVTERELKVYKPKEPIDWMIEVNAGFAAKKGINVGDNVRLDQ